MIKVRARGGETIQQMMKRFKKMCEKEGVIRDIKRQSYYEKPSEKRRGLPGAVAEYIYQRRASAPRASSTLQGSSTLPLDLLLFSPFSSRMWTRLMTCF